MRDLLATDIVLSATKRLAQRLCNDRCADAKIPTPLPTFIAYGDWCIQQWQQAQLASPVPLPRLLNAAQETLLWEKILTHSAAGAALLRIPATARLVAQAFKLCRQWALDPCALPEEGGEDQMAFQGWASSFIETCRQENWIDMASLPNALIAQGQLAGPGRIFWTGFDDLWPQLRHFFEALRRAGYSVQPLEGAARQAQVYQLACKDSHDEITRALQWAKDIVDTTPDAIVAIVVPDLEADRTRIEAAAYGVFEPDFYLRYLNTPFAPPFNISGGTSLIATPMIYSAMKLLTLLDKDISWETLAFFLRCPFIAGAETECYARATLHSQWIEVGAPLWTIEAVIHSLQDVPVPIFHTVCQAIATFRTKLHARHASAWCDYFMDFLGALGWPGARALSSVEYQALAKWQESLALYASLDPILEPQSCGQARMRLWELLAGVLFQGESAEVRVHILGLLEAGGQYFSHWWGLGMHADNWPKVARPNPFLSYVLQKKHQMPHATPERELLFAKSLMQNFEKNTDTMVYSYPLQIDDKMAYPSPLIAHYPPLLLPQSPQMAPVAAATEVYADRGLSLGRLPAPQSTGVRVFQLQAACPFKAFAEIRLHARRTPLAPPFLHAQERGVLVHDLLATLWEKMQNRDGLLVRSDEEIAGFIRQKLAKIQRKNRRFAGMSAKYWAVETERLVDCLLRWLAFEKERPDFQVQACESALTLMIEDQAISLRVDRIDTLAGGSSLLLDYKTYPVAWGDIHGPRPQEPQLLVYLLAYPQIQAMAYGTVSAKGMSFVGVSAVPLDIPGISPVEKLYPGQSWEGLQQQWRGVLEDLMAAFVQGDARVDPKDAMACQRCNLHGLCRVGELGDG